MKILEFTTKNAGWPRLPALGLTGGGTVVVNFGDLSAPWDPGSPVLQAHPRFAATSIDRNDKEFGNHEGHDEHEGLKLHLEKFVFERDETPQHRNDHDVL